MKAHASGTDNVRSNSNGVILCIVIFTILAFLLLFLYLYSPPFKFCNGSMELIKTHGNSKIPISVALTTLPSRVQHIKRTLASLTCQQQIDCEIRDITVYIPQTSNKEPNKKYD